MKEGKEAVLGREERADPPPSHPLNVIPENEDFKMHLTL